uniref:SLIT-ROBO Rho GTPase activating protein 1 n=1 Tax=Scleropages formosus TaxID=113540 RepID=A0A8C9TIA8_SCLFO
VCGFPGFNKDIPFEIRAQLVEQQKCLEQHTEMRVQLLQDLQDFFRKKAEIEVEYSRNLEKLAERFMAKTRSTKDHQQKDQNLLSPINCWYLLLNQVRRESKDHATLSDIYLNNVIMRFMQISEDSTCLLKKTKDITFQLQEDLMKVLNELYTVMKTYHMYHTESMSAEYKLKEAEKQEEKQVCRGGDPVFSMRMEDKYQKRSSTKKMEKMKEKRQAKYSENKLKSIKARNEYLLTLEATNSSVFKYYIHDLSDLIDCCDLGYHASLNRALRTYLSAEYNLETSRHEGLDIIENAVDGLDPRSDRQRFMEMFPTAFCPPAKFEFQPHMGDEVNQITAQPPVQAELLLRFQQLQSRLATLKIENEEIKKTTEATLTTIQDMVTIEDYDVSESFHHSRSTESVKSTVSETYLSKPSMAKRRANQQETEQFYFMKLRELLEGSNLIAKLQAKHDLLKRTLGEGTDPLTMLSARMIVFPPPKDSGQAIPRVVESCIRYINLYGLQHQGIFRVSGSQVEVNDIKNSFERGNDPLTDEENNHDINSVAGVLKLYFRGLENPLFPKEKFNDLISSLYDRALYIRKILLTAPRSVLVVMRYLFAFLNHLSQYSDENMMDPYNLAICFGPTLMPTPDSQDQVSCQAHVNEVIKTIIIHHETIFPDAKELEGPVYEKCMAGGDYCRHRKRSDPPSRRPPARPSDVHCAVHPSPQGHGSGPISEGHYSPRDLLRGRGHAAQDSPEQRRRRAGHSSRQESLKKMESPPIPRSASSGQYGGFSQHHGKPLDPETIAQDIEETMNTALNELRELERQSSAKPAPDVVLDALEQAKSGPVPPGITDSLGSLHGLRLRSGEPPVRRSPSSSGDTMSTFKPTVAPRMGVQLRPPALRPKPPVMPKSGSGQSAAPAPQGSLDKSCTM